MSEELYIKLKELVITMSDEKLDKLINYLLSLKVPHNR